MFNNNKKVIFFIIIVVFILCYSDFAHAALDNSGILDRVLFKYKEAASHWADVMTKYALRLFLSLAIISMVWTFAQMLLKGDSSLADFFGEMVRFGMFTGFFKWLLETGPEKASTIIDSLKKIGTEASGQSNLYPSGIIDIGFELFDKACNNYSLFSAESGLVNIGIAGIILFVLSLVSINMLLQLCSVWVVAYAGIFFLGFGGSRWTSDMAINYFKTVLGVGVSLMTMLLLVGVGTGIVQDAQARMTGGEVLKANELSVLLVVAITLLMLVDKLPPMVSGIITGASVGSMGIGSFGAGAAMGAAMTAGSMASGTASAAKSIASGTVSGAASVAGFASAMKASMSAGGGTAGEGKKQDNSHLLDSLPKPTSPQSGKPMGLGQGVMSMAKQGFQNKVNQSFGGRLASHINESKKSGGDKT